jgi:hypothetical protein
MRSIAPLTFLTLVLLTVSLTPPTVAQDPQFLPAQQVGTVQHAAIDEASGLAASRANPGVLWVHNDSGDAARAFAMNTEGTHLGIYNLTGTSATDWEDMAIGPGPDTGQSYLYLGDIGDNSAVRPTIRIYRVPEPAVSPTQPPVDVDLDDVTTLTLQYPDGSRDAETLMVDPTTADLYIVSKRETRSRLYRAPYPHSTTQTIIMEYRGQLPWGGATAGDISPNGAEILVRGYFSASLWRRPPDTPLWEAFTHSGYRVPLTVEPQGEAIAFHGSGHGYYTVSEGSSQPIYYYERAPDPGDLDRDGDIDIDDFTILADCLDGPDVPPASACDRADLTADADVDLADCAEFQRLFPGP